MIVFDCFYHSIKFTGLISRIVFWAGQRRWRNTRATTPAALQCSTRSPYWPQVLVYSRSGEKVPRWNTHICRLQINLTENCAGRTWRARGTAASRSIWGLSWVCYRARWTSSGAGWRLEWGRMRDWRLWTESRWECRDCCRPMRRRWALELNEHKITKLK